ncbi:hypothetical protein MIB92_05870 [Aestuariirhabdus sp. Z084]|uniref:hypothetical protein n=1 Tax=Aestuariirhabdus haliotis TaxID=2918751 RepID=UPI00201B3D26|nr:hypothetical protein [Aestuariirhabdus haliotis]MCL6415171.1 hypothetical protein [Aestuariirhabdus haliotis]MCL6420046.1 hypothetical protein [Aestuariirhabdus haliotis]
MKYFTDEKCEQNIAHTEYEDYCKSIWEDLPVTLKQISEGMLPESYFVGLETVGLHDARIIDFAESSSRLCIELDTDNRGGLRKVWLTYDSSNIIVRPSEEMLGKDIDNYKSDVMCHEVELGESGSFLHRLLFCSGEELEVQFSSIELEYKDVV